MRVMMIVKGNEDTENAVMPTTEELAEMQAFNEQLVKSGVMLAGEGLRPTAEGAKVVFSDKGARVIDGPFTEAKEVIAGFWILDVKSLEEALEWAKRVPFKDGELEVRPVQADEDFGDAMTPELKAGEDELRRQIKEQHGS